MPESIQDWRRTDKCGELTTGDIDREVTIMGWVQRRRDHGGVIFVDIRDRSGIVQAVFNPEFNKQAFVKADNLRSEYVVAIRGSVRARPEGNINPEIPTGHIEIKSQELKILDEARTPPIQIEDEIETGEDLRLKYRYLDLRRPRMKEIMGLRHRVMKSTRDYLSAEDFWEIETPVLTRSTPEGARDYLVPSRINSGQFYALPQSPQLFKQLLMVSGMERYFQIARCFRDEDLRANRQPEFTQIDLEMSFLHREELFDIVEGLMQVLFELGGIEVPEEIPIMTYEQAMDKYGTDKPDLRFGMELHNISEIVADSDFNIFSGTVGDGGQVKGIRVKQGADLPRNKLDQYTDFVKNYRAKGLAWIIVKEDEVKSPIAKFLSDPEIKQIIEEMGAEPGDLLMFVADKQGVVADALGHLRLKVAEDLELINTESYEFTWIVDFPLFEYDEEEGRFVAKHHPFTAPRPSDIELLDQDPAAVKANAYDLVLNGEELGGGSIRINNKQLQ
ncbi:MAG: aspartate--tRNA ligase, partial [Bacillota bacterium]